MAESKTCIPIPDQNKNQMDRVQSEISSKASITSGRQEFSQQNKEGQKLKNGQEKMLEGRLCQDCLAAI